MPASGRRGWKRGTDRHARSFLEAEATFRRSADGHDENGPVGFWGEWEGAVEIVRELDSVDYGPRWLGRPNPVGPPPETSDGTPAQNTDPFVFGDQIRYTFCRQPGNSKLRELGRGTLILFGSSPARGIRARHRPRRRRLA